MGLYDTSAYKRAADLAASMFARVVEPRGLYKSNAEWVERFPKIAWRCDALLCLTRETGSIAVGAHGNTLQRLSRDRHPGALSLSPMAALNLSKSVDGP
jgi:hypothetical protein